MFGVRKWLGERTQLCADVFLVFVIGKDMFKNRDKISVLLFDGKLL